MIALRSGSATDVGLVRSNNQDRLLEANPLFAVADGMGGAAAGEVASATAIDALQEWFAGLGTPTPDDLLRGAEKANRAVWDRAEANPEMRGMGTTLVSVALVESGKVAIANVGDSRVYALHHGVLRQVTEDHNLVAEMVAQGRLSAEEAEFHPRRNIMTRALGVEPAVPVDLFLEEAEPGVRYLLCSDGLPREIKDDQIASILRRLSDPAEAAKELVDEAIRKGGNDNITVVIVDVVDLSGEEGDATSVVPETPPDVPEERTRVRGGGAPGGGGPPPPPPPAPSPPSHSTGCRFHSPSRADRWGRRCGGGVVCAVGIFRRFARTGNHRLQGPPRRGVVVEADGGGGNEHVNRRH
jgi:serine/threonine protein phosphatase PrpC